MKSTLQTKTIKKNVINLQPVQIDVELSQKTIPNFKINPQYQKHLKTLRNPNVVIQYNNILNEIIEDLLVSLSENIHYDFSSLQQLSKIKKQGIDYINVLNMEFIQKLSYLLERCQRLQYDDYQSHVKVLKQEIKYWKQFIFFALNDHSEQIQKYGEITKNKKKNQVNLNLKQDDIMEPSEIPKSQNTLKKQESGKESSKRVKNEQDIVPYKIPKAPRRNGRNRNGNSVNQISDNIDN